MNSLSLKTEPKLTEEDINFLTWVLGNTASRVIGRTKERKPDPARALEIARRCEELAVKLQTIPT